MSSLDEQTPSLGAGLQSLADLLQLAAVLAPSGRNTDLALEATSALLGVLGVIRDTPPRAASSRLGCCLSVVHQLEPFSELATETRLGDVRKWDVLLALEAVKAALRLASVQRAGGCVLLSDRTPGLPLPRDLAALAAEQSAAERAANVLRALSSFRSGRACAVGYPPACLLAPSPPMHASSLAAQRRVIALLYAGETLRALRPVVYCAAVRRMGRRSWRPWLLSLAMDTASLALLQRAAPRSAAEQEELRRRKASLALYVLFSPAYEAVLQPPLREIAHAGSGVPLLGSLLDRGNELLDSVLAMHCYTTAL
jgi:peroxin-16